MEYTHALLNAMTEFITFRQLQLTLSEYFQGFNDRMEHLERLPGPLGQEEGRVQDYVKRSHPDPSKITVSQLEEAEEACRQAFLATALKKRWHGLHCQVKNYHALGKMGYPKSLVDACNRLNQWEAESHVQNGVSFLQQDDTNQGTTRRGLGRTGRNNSGGNNGSVEANQGS